MRSRLSRALLSALLCLAAPAVRAGTSEAAPPAMTMLQAAVLGVVEGVTEYLPVSSTGHLILAQRMMGIGQAEGTSEAANAYAVCIQLGAILAVVGLYFRRVRQMAAGCLGRNPEGLKLGVNLIVAFLPAAVIGLAFEKLIKQYLFGGNNWGLWPLVAALLLGGVVILIADRYLVTPRQREGRGSSLTELSWKMALGIGLVQCAAMWPGTSRSLATILGGLFAGLTLGAAVEFSFLLGLITLTASTALDAVRYGPTMINLYGWAAPGIGLLVAALSAIMAVKWMVHYLQKHPLAFFGYYRILLALGIAAFMLWD
jgi:undecaprenyl-diphosphatase